MKSTSDQIHVCCGGDISTALVPAVRKFLKFPITLAVTMILVSFGPAALRTVCEVSSALLLVVIEVLRISLFVLQIFVK
jgi:hypothetical protein